MTPDSTYVSQNEKVLPGQKQSKERITLLCLSGRGPYVFAIKAISTIPTCTFWAINAFLWCPERVVILYASVLDLLKEWDAELCWEKEKALLLVGNCKSRKLLPWLPNLREIFLTANAMSTI